MLKLDDFLHLPVIDTLVSDLLHDEAGVVLVAGLEARVLPATAEADPDQAPGAIRPGGRSTVFRLLRRGLLEARPEARAVIVAQDTAFTRVPRRLRHRVDVLAVEPPVYDYIRQIDAAARRQVDLLVLDHLNEHTARAALEAAQSGVTVLAQLDTFLRAGLAVRHLHDYGARPADLAGMTWIVAVQRIPTLCPHCKQPAPPDAAQLASLRAAYPDFDLPETMPGVCRPVGCPRCGSTGYHGDALLFDFWRNDPTAPDVYTLSSRLPMARYALDLAASGYVALDDARHFATDEFRRAVARYETREQVLLTANAALERRLAELEAGNRVLEESAPFALISVQEVGQAILTSANLDDLAARVCRRARDLCGGDRAMLYYIHEDETTEILAVSGWPDSLLHEAVEARAVRALTPTGKMADYYDYPPGVPLPMRDGVIVRAGLAVPLQAGGRQVGLMLVQAKHHTQFAPGRTSLLQTFADQAAMAIQRAGLFEQLHAKIAALEAAQAQLARKERLERELELARQVQQSMIPRTFPAVAGYQFAARSVPARQVGGDFYDVFPLDDDHFGVAIGDVSDKGLPAALYMALTRSLLLAEARRALSPQDVLSNVNRLLLELSTPTMFVTVFYGVIERSARRLTYTRAGHDRPFLLRNQAAQELGGTGTPLGLFADDMLVLSEEALDLAPEDTLVLYTDGLTDVENTAGEMFDKTRLAESLRTAAGGPPESLCTATFETLAAYRGEAAQFDDMSLVVVGVG